MINHKKLSLEELLRARDIYTKMMQLHSGPHGLRTYRQFYESRREEIDKLIRDLAKDNSIPDPEREREEDFPLAYAGKFPRSGGRDG